MAVSKLYLVMLVKPLNLKKDCSPQSNRTTQRTDRIVF
ncbi:MAG: hypothetical protein ACI8QG_002622, partial [Flavobacteriales bacterium]